MNANERSRGIRIAEEALWNVGCETNYAEEDLHKLSLRQLSVFYHLIHNRLDRPLVGEEYWPECLRILREELYSALLAQKIPESWLKAFLPGRKSELERAARELYISSLHPLLPAARKEIEEMVKNLERIESQAQKFWNPYRKRRYLKSELGMIGHCALKRAWEFYNVLNLYASRSMVGRPRQEAGSWNNSPRKVAPCAAV